MNVGNNKATRQGVQWLFLYHAPEYFQDTVAAAIARTQKEDARMTAGRQTANISKIQVEREEHSAFRNRSLPDHRIIRSAETLFRHAIGGIARVIQEIHMRLREVLIQLEQECTHRKGPNSSSPARTAA